MYIKNTHTHTNYIHSLKSPTKFSFCFMVCFLWSASPLGAFWQTPGGLPCAFWPPCHAGLIAMETAVLLEVPQRNSDKPAIELLVTSLTKGLSTQVPHGQPALRVLLGLERLPLTDDGGHCALWDLQSSRIGSATFPSPRFVPACLVLGCALPTVGPSCAFPDHVQLTEFTTGGQKKISKK